MAENKYAAIVHNYNYPSDRFSQDYAKPGQNQTIFDLIETAGKQGLVKGLEMNFDDSPPAACVGINHNNWQDVMKALGKYDIELIGIAPPLWSGVDYMKGTLGSAKAEVRESSKSLIKSVLDLAEMTGCPFVNIWPGQDGFDYYFETDYQKLYTWWVEGIQELADYKPEIKLGLEPKPFEPRSYSFISTVAKSLLLIKDIDRENVGVNIDVGHLLYAHESLGESVAMLHLAGDKLFHLHLNDNYAGSDEDMMFASVHLLAYIEMFYWLRKTHYSGWKSLDLFPYRTDPAATIGEGVRWMMAIDNMLDEIGMEALDELIARSDPVENMAFFRKQLFGK